MSNAMENILFNFYKKVNYSVTPTVQIGTDEDLTNRFDGQTALRTIPTVSGDTYHVRKSGTLYEITDITNATIATSTTSAGETLVYTFKGASSGTVLGSITDEDGSVGAFVDGSTISDTDGVKLEISCTSGNVVPTTQAITIFTDIDAGGLSVKIPQEQPTDGYFVTLYISASGSSYYDSVMLRGGARHTATGTEKYPFFHPYDALSSLGADDAISVDDSQYYTFPYYSGGALRYEIDMDQSGSKLFAIAGESPKIGSVIGASKYREQFALHNNYNTVFYNENGEDYTYTSPKGFMTWKYPCRTLANAQLVASATGGITVYGGSGATETGGKYDEEIELPYTDYMEAEYGYTPSYYRTDGGDVFTMGAKQIYGIIVDGSYSEENAIKITSTSSSVKIVSCNIIEGRLSGIFTSEDLSASILCNNISGNFYLDTTILSSASSLTIQRNIITGITFQCTGATSVDVSNNIVINGLGIRFYVPALATSFNISNNTITKCYQNGITANLYGGSFTGTIDSNVVHGNNTSGGSYYDLNCGTGTFTITNSCYGTNSGFTIGSGTINADPLLSDSASGRYGLLPNSPALKTASRDDMGALLRIVEINNSDIEINGICIDCFEQMNNAIYIKDDADHDGTIIKYCHIKNSNGIGFDPYDDDTDTNFQLLNSVFENCANPVKVSQGGNVINYCEIYQSIRYGIFIENVGTMINHCAIYDSYEGIYIESNAGAINIRNCIFNGNAIASITSEIAIKIMYCCVTDSLSSNIDSSDLSNIVDNPLFIDADNGNFNLKCIEYGYTIESPCIDAGESDIGAQQVSRLVVDYTWQKYRVPRNPTRLNIGNIVKGQNITETGLGSIKINANAHKRVLPMAWENPLEVTKELRETIEFIRSLIPTRENGYTEDETIIRTSLKPDSYLETGSSAVIDATAKTLTDSTKTWRRNAMKGWHVGIKYETQTGTVSESADTITVSPSPAWTTDEWIGYFVYLNDQFFYILGNTGDVLTVSDVDSDLTDGSVSFSIEKYFKILSNTGTVMTLRDDDDELISGTNDYYVNFIEARVQDSSFEYDENGGYNFDAEHRKAGFELPLEEA